MPPAAQEGPCTEETAEERWVNDEAAGDQISLGERRRETLSLGAEGGVTGTEHKAAHDSVTFTETIGDEIEEEESVPVTRTNGEEGGDQVRYVCTGG